MTKISSKLEKKMEELSRDSTAKLEEITEGITKKMGELEDTLKAVKRQVENKDPSNFTPGLQGRRLTKQPSSTELGAELQI